MLVATKRNESLDLRETQAGYLRPSFGGVGRGEAPRPGRALLPAETLLREHLHCELDGVEEPLESKMKKP